MEREVLNKTQTDNEISEDGEDATTDLVISWSDVRMNRMVSYSR